MTRGASSGHLFAIVRIEVPTVVDEEAKALAFHTSHSRGEHFDPRAKLAQEAGR